MVIGVNARVLLLKVLEGIGWYTHEILRRLVQDHPEHTFVFYVDRPFKEEFRYGPNVEIVEIAPRTVHPAIWHLWFQYLLPRYAHKRGCDVLLSLEGFAPARSKVPTITVLHDLGFIHVPQQMNRVMRGYYTRMFPRIARGVARLGTVSEFSRRDIAHQYGIDPARISVIHNSVRAAFVPLVAERVQQVRHRITGGAPYLVFVGVLQPRKNVVRMLQAFDAFKSKTGSEIKLVVAGRKGWIDEGVEATIQGMAHMNDVVFTGYIPDAELADVVGAAHAMLFVPLFEGFGVPALEAMTCGVPVVTTLDSPMADVTEGAAVLVNPLSVQSIAAGIESVVMDEPLRQRLSVQGIERARQFTWEESARITWQLVEELTSVPR